MKTIFCTLLTMSLFLTHPISAGAESLQSQLDAKAKAGKADEKTKAIMNDAIEALRKSKLAERGLKVGDTFPDFTLPDSEGQKLSLAAARKEGAVIVTFFRGSWCPYCNIQLLEYQKHADAWKAKGARLVAISPELAEKSKALKAKLKLTFPLLFDEDNALAQKAGIAFGLPADLKEVYKKFGIDLAAANGSQSWQLPIAATFVIGADGKVLYAFKDPDYKKRAEPSEITAALPKKR